ncbi:NAD(P)-dependent alcohol dehydrogenase [Arenibacterium sp. CAU 1754]
MKAALSERYGPPDVVGIRDVPKPTPKPDEVLVQVRATTVSRTDCGMREPHPFFIRLSAGLMTPKTTILGMDFAGVVDAVGPNVTRFEPGDRVFGMSPETYGAHAGFLCVAETGQIATMPDGVSFHEVVLCEGAWYAQTCLKWLDLNPGDKLLIYGASGAVGTAAVQLATASGFTVTAVVGTRHLDLARALGADQIVDYTQEDFTQLTDRFDGVLDAVGKTTFFQCRKLMKPTARYASTDLGPYWQNLLLAFWSNVTGRNRVNIPFPEQNQGLVRSLKDLIQAGKLRAVIDRHYPLEDIEQAYRYVETGQKTGIVVIDIAAETGRS